MAKAEAALTNVPTTWTGAFDIYKYSKQAVLFNTQTMLTLFVLSILLGIPGALQGDAANILDFFTSIATVFVSMAIVVASFAGLRSQKMTFNEALAASFSLRTLKFVVSTILVTVLALASLVLLIVPFFFVLPRLVLAPYLVVDKDVSPVESIRQSWAMSKGHSGKVWGIIGVTILFGILSIILVGLYFLFIYQAAFVVLYAYVMSQQSTPDVQE